MNLFKSSFQLQLNARENLIKETLLNTLNENAKEIQFEFKENGKDYLEQSDSTNSLCTTIEAMFLHGLKDSFLWQTMNVISGDVDRRPEPSFWPTLLVFMHKDVIKQIHSMPRILTEAGYCRCWVRLSLNDSLLSSYLNNIRKNSSALNPYYKKYAFMKDSDNIELASKILEGIESCVQINLPVNYSLLNQWPDLSLQLAGVWTPPLRSCPIASGEDVASLLSNNVVIPTPKPVQINEAFAESISSSPFNLSAAQRPVDLTDTESLQVLLDKIDESKVYEAGKANERKEFVQESISKTSTKKDKTCKTNLRPTITLSAEEVTGNSVAAKTCWSGSVDDNATNNNVQSPEDQNEPKIFFSRSNSMTTSVSSLKSPIDGHSYNSLLVKHKNTSGQVWNDVWQRLEHSISNSTGGDMSNNETSEGGLSEALEDLGFETLPPSWTEKFSVYELQTLVAQTCKLSREYGLDLQGFVCKSCAHPLGVGMAPIQVCEFSGYYFCESCISLDQFVIPAKVIYNWDFRKYSVSKKAAIFLTEFGNQPFIDLKLHNPDIYMACDIMAHLQSLRIKLNYIRVYLFSCSESIIDNLQKRILDKKYLYNHIHQYTINDVISIMKGNLCQLLEKTVEFGEEHIRTCPLCSQKGFVCETCTSSKVLYPFDLDTTFRCQLCGAVYHAQCLDESQPCPKCERRRKREDLPLFEAVNML